MQSQIQSTIYTLLDKDAALFKNDASLFLDIIIHKRMIEENLLVIEVKKQLIKHLMIVINKNWKFLETRYIISTAYLSGLKQILKKLEWRAGNRSTKNT